MIEKSKESKAFFKRDPCNKKNEKKAQEQDENDESSVNMFNSQSKNPITEERKKLRISFKLDNMIINQNSTWKKIFDTTILFVIGYSCVVTFF